MLNIVQKSVENFWQGRNGFKPEQIVIHIGEGNKYQIYSEFLDKKSNRSSHYLVCKNLEIWQFVNEEDSAWGNGKVFEPTDEIVKSRIGQNPNYWSISIEHEGKAIEGINPAMYAVTAELVEDICRRRNIPIDEKHIIRHETIDKKKTCPGLISVNKIIQDAKKNANLKNQLSLYKKLLALYQKLLNLVRTQ